MDDMKQCPFCGNDNIGYREEGLLIMMWCIQCDCFGPSANSFDEALEKWNKRLTLHGQVC